jgi:hypothetical protein
MYMGFSFRLAFRMRGLTYRLVPGYYWSETPNPVKKIPWQDTFGGTGARIPT